MTVTADTITDAQVHDLRASLEADLTGLADDPRFWTTPLRAAITETEWAQSSGDPFRRHLARARCAEILNARSNKVAP